MDLLKEEERLTKKRDKAMETFSRKSAYLDNARRSVVKAQHEAKCASRELSKIRKQIKSQGVDDLTVPEPLDYPDEPVTIHTPSVKPTPVEEENTD